VDDFDFIFTSKVVTALEHALVNSTRPIKGSLFTNPQNPLGQCYPKAVIEDIVNFCNSKKIHFISDELYALSVFNVPDHAELELFVPVMSLDLGSFHDIRGSV
jgi:aspartate/methionine/tyrosine aminotransferase